jgi:hypothetical protein
VNDRGTYGSPLIPLYCRDDSGLPPVPEVLLDSRGTYGQHSFHGHEAPIYGSGDYARVDHATHWGLSWKPRLEIVGHRRGTYGSPRVGEMSTTQAMLMTPAAISAELARIDQAMHAFDIDLSKAAHAVAQSQGYPTLELTPGTSAADQKQAVADYLKALAKATSVRKPPLEAAAVFALYQQQWIPLFTQWMSFYGEEKGGSWWHNAAYDAEKYLSQLVQMRKRAKELGVKLLSPDPAEEHDGESWASLAKWGLIGGGVIGGVWALSKIISSVRSR